MGLPVVFLQSARSIERAVALSSTTHFLPHTAVSTLGWLALLCKYSEDVADLEQKWNPMVIRQNLQALLLGIAKNSGGWTIPICEGDSWKPMWPAEDGCAAFMLQAFAV